MVQRCKNCGRKIIRFPMWKGQEEGVPCSPDKINWFNLFKIDFYTLLWMAVVIFMIVAYKLDMKECEDAIVRPCDFCETTGCYDLWLLGKEWGQYSDNPSLWKVNRNLVDIKDIPDFNSTE